MSGPPGRGRGDAPGACRAACGSRAGTGAPRGRPRPAPSPGPDAGRTARPVRLGTGGGACTRRETSASRIVRAAVTSRWRASAASMTVHGAPGAEVRRRKRSTSGRASDAVSSISQSPRVDPPALLPLPLLQPGPLHLGRSVQEQLHDERAVGEQLGLQLLEVGGPGLERAVVDTPGDAGLDLAEQPPGPDRQAPARRHRPPEPPQTRPSGLLRTRVPEDARVDVPRVHPLVQPLDDLAGRRAIVAGDEHDGREVRRPQVELRVQQPDAQLGDDPLEVLLRESVAGLRGLQHVRLPHPTA